MIIDSPTSLPVAYECGSENNNLPTPPAGYSWSLNKQFTDEFSSWDAIKWWAKHDWWNGFGANRPGAYYDHHFVIFHQYVH
jgi:hypothetical protein